MCAGHFTELVTENPLPDSDDPLILFRWSVHIHNLVNARIGKPILEPEQAMERWTTKSPAPTPDQFDFKIVVIVLLVLGLIFMLLRGKEPFGLKLYKFI